MARNTMTSKSIDNSDQEKIDRKLMGVYGSTEKEICSIIYQMRELSTDKRSVQKFITSYGVHLKDYTPSISVSRLNEGVNSPRCKGIRK